MSSATVCEVIARKRKAYEKASKREKSRMLDELVELTGYHRKSLVRGFRRCRHGQGKRRSPPGRPPRYEVVRPALHKVWGAAFFACGKRLRPFLPELVRLLKAGGELTVTATEEGLLLSMSAATMDRLLSKERAQLRLRGKKTTKPGTLLRTSIPVRMFDQWNEQEAGFFEVDLVAHCGSSTKGEYLYTLDMTDVHTGWTVLAPMKGRGQRGAHVALEKTRRSLPFALRGLDSDNDSIFINQHIRRYCEQHSITFTRCRPYKKNDQCHVEQKNWSVVRQFVGYVRLETDEQLALLQRVYDLVNRYHNFYWPMMRLVSKQRNGSKVTKRYDQAKTPYQRLLACDGLLSQQQRERLQRDYDDPANNPARLLRNINALLDRLSETLPCSSTETLPLERFR